MSIPALLLLPAAAAQGGAIEVPRDPSAPAHALTYTITKDGLVPPNFEGGATEFECADVDLDGHVDIVSVGDHGSPFIGTNQHGVMVWRGDGAGGWSLVMDGDLGYGGVAVGDVNGDGLPDVGYGVHHDYSATDFGDQLLEVALGNGTASGWTPWDDGLGTSGETWGMFGTDFGDIDADGDLDLGANSFGCCAGLRVYRNAGDGTWSATFVGPGSNSDMDFVFRDFNGDGHLDIVAANQGGVAWRGDGTGAFVDAGLAAGSYFGVDAGDVDGDGADEVVTITGSTPRLWRWGTGDQWSDVTGGVAGPGSYDLAQLCDLDVDGHTDLAAFGDGTVTYWINDGTGGFGPPKSGTTPGSGTKHGEAFEVSRDLDHNGYPDMVLLQDEGSLFGGGGNEMVTVFESSTPTAAWVRPTEPSANRVWRGGQARFLAWACALRDASAGSGLVTLELSTSGYLGPWSLLASGVPNNGRHQLVVPSGITSTTCVIRATVLLPAGGVAQGVSLAPFTILP